MTERFRCGDGAALVTFLYDECEPLERDGIAAHVAGCATCTAQLDDMAGTRRQLAEWTPPTARLGFSMTGDEVQTVVDARDAFGTRKAADTNGRAAAWWHRPLPAWAQAAAALVIFAAGMAAGSARQTPAATTVSSVNGPSPIALQQDLRAIEKRLAGVEAGVEAGVNRVAFAPGPAAPSVASAPSGRSTDAVLMRRVSELIAASEQRQRQERAVLSVEFMKEIEDQRRQDNDRTGRLVRRAADDAVAQVFTASWAR